MRNLLALPLLVVSLTLPKADAAIVYDTFNGVSGFEAPSPLSPRILDSITLEQSGTQVLDGLRLRFTVTNASVGDPQPMIAFVEFWDNVDFGSDDPLANATSLGTVGINFGDRTVNGGFGGGISTGLYDQDDFDIFLPGDGTEIGVEYRFRSDGSTFQPNVSGRLVDAPNAIGNTSDNYYLDTGTDGFSSGDLVSKNGKVLGLELNTIAPIPEPGSLLALSLVAIGSVVHRRRR